MWTYHDDIATVDDESSNASGNERFDDIWAARQQKLSRRHVLGLGTALSALALNIHAAEAASRPVFDFKEVRNDLSPRDAVADGHVAELVIGWGDPLFADAPAFDVNNQSAAAQARQFGFNNDYVGFVPLPLDAARPTRGLLTVNHEYTQPEMMLPGYRAPSADSVAIEQAATGVSVVEIEKQPDGHWRYKRDSRYNRRIMAAQSPVLVSGPAAGHARLKTKADPSGTIVMGTMNNCGGGITPWGTTLHAEENFNFYFAGSPPKDGQEKSRARYNMPAARYFKWHEFDSRFDLSNEPNEPNRFGWVVELDPTNPDAPPKKRTALGRFKHEGAQSVLNKDGRVVIYMGDDQRFDYVYRFVTAGKVDPNNRAANMDLLDDGVLSVARFNDDGTLDWLPLVHGVGPLTEANGFASQADVLIDARLAADALGATKMDRPEDVEAHPQNGKAYVMLTNNHKRKASQTNAANPRAKNYAGHIIEMRAPRRDHGADRFSWEMLVECGPPQMASATPFNKRTSNNGWFGAPDNCAIDGEGRLWVATDGMKAGTVDRNDGLFALETSGPGRGTSKLFYKGPVGAEITGPVFTADTKTVFLSVQHPGVAGAKDLPGFNRPAKIDDAPTAWPDFASGKPVRPGVIAIRRRDGGKIG